MKWSQVTLDHTLLSSHQTFKSWRQSKWAQRKKKKEASHIRVYLHEQLSRLSWGKQLSAYMRHTLSASHNDRVDMKEWILNIWKSGWGICFKWKNLSRQLCVYKKHRKSNGMLENVQAMNKYVQCICNSTYCKCNTHIPAVVRWLQLLNWLTICDFGGDWVCASANKPWKLLFARWSEQ